MSEQDETPEGTDESAPKRDRRAPVMQNPLGKPGDHASRPGFRDPANTKSKAQKKNRKKKRKK